MKFSKEHEMRKPQAALSGLVLAALLATPALAADNNATPDNGQPPHWKLLEQSCEKCHNPTDWGGGVAFDTMTRDSIA